MLPNDPRKVRTSSSPKWMEAVGRLENTLSSNKKEQCSLTLISDHPSKDGIIAVTAGHCVDHWVKGDGSFDVGKNEASFLSHSGKTIKRSITQVLKAETDKGDYAIVKLNASIKKSEIEPLINAPYDYSDMLDADMFGEKFKPFATMAGYSADTGKGQKGKVQTYHEGCQLNGGSSGMKKGYCYSYAGASGGAVTATVDLGELADESWQVGKRTYFVGSIIGARQGDDNSKTMFTETTHYSKELDGILARH